MKKVNESKRSFGGKISDFKNRGEANFERAHLKNYLKGNKTFEFGFSINPLSGMRAPTTRVVQEIWS